MPDLNIYMRLPEQTGEWLNDYARSPQFMIDHQPTTITLLAKDGSVRAAQEVRLAYLIQRADEAVSAGGISGQNELILIGTPTFIVARGDRFVMGTARYEVTFVDTSIPGKIEAKASAVQ